MRLAFLYSALQKSEIVSRTKGANKETKKSKATINVSKNIEKNIVTEVNLFENVARPPGEEKAR